MTQTVGVALPATKQLRDLLETQLGREVTLRPTYPLPASGRRLAFAIYVDDHLATRAVVVADLPAVAYIAAAAGLVPVGVATAAVREQTLPALLTDPLQDVAGGWTQLFARSGSDPVSRRICCHVAKSRCCAAVSSALIVTRYMSRPRAD